MVQSSTLRDSSATSDMGQSDFRITPESDDNLLLHSHVHLNVTVDGKQIIIPANIGIDPKLHKDNFA